MKHTIALDALYARKLAGAFRSIYVVTTVMVLYLNVNVLFAQLFANVPALKSMAPTQAEPPFAIAQGIVLVLFLLLGWKARKKFHPATANRIGDAAAAWRGQTTRLPSQSESDASANAGEILDWPHFDAAVRRPRKLGCNAYGFVHGSGRS